MPGEVKIYCLSPFQNTYWEQIEFGPFPCFVKRVGVFCSDWIDTYLDSPEDIRRESGNTRQQFSSIFIRQGNRFLIVVLWATLASAPADKKERGPATRVRKGSP